MTDDKYSSHRIPPGIDSGSVWATPTSIWNSEPSKCFYESSDIVKRNRGLILRRFWFVANESYTDEICFDERPNIGSQRPRPDLLYSIVNIGKVLAFSI